METKLHLAAAQIVEKIEPDADARAQISPAIIAILIEFLPKLIEGLLKNCNESASVATVQGWCNQRQGLRGRWRRRLVNLKANQFFGTETMSDLGGIEFGSYVMDVGADPNNAEAVREAMETKPPVWGVLG